MTDWQNGRLLSFEHLAEDQRLGVEVLLEALEPSVSGLWDMRAGWEDIVEVMHTVVQHILGGKATRPQAGSRDMANAVVDSHVWVICASLAIGTKGTHTVLTHDDLHMVQAEASTLYRKAHIA